MFYIYLQILLWGQPHGSCCTFRDPHSKNFRVVLDHGLDACLVVHVLDEFLGGFVSHSIRLSLESLLASKEILHIDVMYPVIISRISNQCDVLSNVVRERLTQSSVLTRCALLVNTLPSRSGVLGRPMCRLAR